MSKYRAIPVEIDGHRFASKAEGRRYSQLKLLEAAGEIRDIVLQPRYPLVVEGEKIGTYVGDFLYRDRLTGGLCLEDVKSPPTAKRSDYRMKKRLVKALFGIEIREVINP